MRESADLASRRSDLLFSVSPVPCVLVGPTGGVLDANPAAVRALNVSQRHLAGRPFHMFIAADRQEFLERVARLSSKEQPERWNASLRPRERSLIPITLVAYRDSANRVVVMLLPRDADRAAPGVDGNGNGRSGGRSLGKSSAGMKILRDHLDAWSHMPTPGIEDD